MQFGLADLFFIIGAVISGLDAAFHKVWLSAAVCSACIGLLVALN